MPAYNPNELLMENASWKAVQDAMERSRTGVGGPNQFSGYASKLPGTGNWIGPAQVNKLSESYLAQSMFGQTGGFFEDIFGSFPLQAAVLEGASGEGMGGPGEGHAGVAGAHGQPGGIGADIAGLGLGIAGMAIGGLPGLATTGLARKAGGIPGPTTAMTNLVNRALRAMGLPYGTLPDEATPQNPLGWGDISGLGLGYGNDPSTGGLGGGFSPGGFGGLGGMGMGDPGTGMGTGIGMGGFGGDVGAGFGEGVSGGQGIGGGSGDSGDSGSGSGGVGGGP